MYEWESWKGVQQGSRADYNTWICMAKSLSPSEFTNKEDLALDYMSCKGEEKPKGMLKGVATRFYVDTSVEISQE